ncbi:MBL fold metallo-hydrolase [Lentibacillus sp. Marseille-P4043]|uniref:MBL fold metallo-hydrolase n=1 Tax=Lentibacillus sp. Marseille-P4043 TaxID=2040293 RepID=UPI000D0BB0EF|nr:MBL fold metallo-hydrolase [Lentibacillus sp. Marseille-P4043]
MMHVSKEEDVTCVKMDIMLGGKKANTVYAFLVDGMLVDTGPQSLEAELTPFYDKHSFDFVALTHSHEDHTGTAPWIQENREVPIYVHQKGIEICAEKYNYPKYRQIFWGKREGFEASPLGDTIQSANNEWKVIYTPGHADDHVSFFNEETGTLFSGDLFVAPKTKVIMNSESIPTIMESIRAVLNYDVGSMFCCHAGYIKNGKSMLKQKLDYLENLSGEVKYLYNSRLSITEIREKIFPKKYSIISRSGGEWDSLHIITSILSDEI